MYIHTLSYTSYPNPMPENIYIEYNKNNACAQPLQIYNLPIHKHFPPFSLHIKRMKGKYIYKKKTNTHKNSRMGNRADD